MITFSQWLKQRRKTLGLTQRDLAQQAGCAEVTLRKIEAGDLRPSALLAASLAKAVRAVDADTPNIVEFALGTDIEHMPAARWSKAHRPNNLPAQLTPLIGREQDLAAVRRRMLSDGARLITLLGPPGVGKTRLALAVAENVMEQFEHGAYSVRLGPISDPDLVASAIIQALGVQISGSNSPALQLRATLEEKHLLLVLDNFEQVIEAAKLVDDLLHRCPWLYVVVTSRQPLRVRGERQFRCHRWPCPPESTAPLGSRPAMRFAIRLWLCLRTAPRPCSLILPSPTPTLLLWLSCAAGLTDCRWRSSWLRPASNCCRQRSYWPGSAGHGCSR